MQTSQLLTPGASEPGHQVQALGNYYLHQTPAHDFIGVNRLTDGLALTSVEHITNFSDGDFYTWADAASSSISIDGSGNGPGSYTLTPEAHNNIVLKNEPDPLATTDPRFFIYVSPNQPIEQFHVTLLGVNPSHVVWIVNGSIEFSGPAEIPGLLTCNGTATFSGLTTYTPALWIRDKAIFSTVSGSGPLYTTSCLKSLNQQSYDSGKTMLQTLFGRDNSVFLHSDYASSYNPLTLNYRSSMHSGGSNLYPSDSLLVGSGTSVTNMDKEVDSLMTVMDSNMLRTYAISSGAGGRLNPGIYNVDGGSNLSNFHLTGDDRSIYIFLVGGTFNPDQMDYGLVKPENVYFYGKFLSVSSPTSARGVFVAGGISIYAPDIQAALYAGGGISIASTRARAYGPRGRVLNIHLAPSNSLAKLSDSTLSLCASSGAVPVSIITSFATSLRVQSLQDTTVTSDQTYALLDSAGELTTVYIPEAATSLRLVGMSVGDTLRKPDITIQRRPSGVLNSLFPMIGALDSVSGNYRVADTSGFLLTAFADTAGLDSLVWNFSTGEKRITASNTLTHPPLLWMHTIMARVLAYRDGCPSVERSIGYSGGYPEPVDQPQVHLDIRFSPVVVPKQHPTGLLPEYKIEPSYSYDSNKVVSDYQFWNQIRHRFPNQLVSVKYSGYEFMPYTRMVGGPSMPYPGVYQEDFNNEKYLSYMDAFGSKSYSINISLFFHNSCPQNYRESVSCGSNTIHRVEGPALGSQFWYRTDGDCYGSAVHNFSYRYAYPPASSRFKHSIEYSYDSTLHFDKDPNYVKVEWEPFEAIDHNLESSGAYSSLHLKFRASGRGSIMRLARNTYLQLTRWKIPRDAYGIDSAQANGTAPHNRYHVIKFTNPENPNEFLVLALIKPKKDRGFFGAIWDIGTNGISNTSNSLSYVHDRALKNTCPIVYSWSNLEGRDLYDFASDLKTDPLTGFEYIERALEIRIFTCPKSERAYSEKLGQVLSDILDEVAVDYPFSNDFPFRGPISPVFVSDTGRYNSLSVNQHNPNRYSDNDHNVTWNIYSNYSTRNIDSLGWVTFRQTLLGKVAAACQGVSNLQGTGVIVWDLEGQPTDKTNSLTSQKVSYVGDLETMLQGGVSSAPCAELLRSSPGNLMTLADEVFDTIQRGSKLIPGITIRPQKLQYDPSAGPNSSCQQQVPFVIHKYMWERQQDSINNLIADLLARKMFYAYSKPYNYYYYDSTYTKRVGKGRWGVRIFYVDSPYTWDLFLGNYRRRRPLDPQVYSLAREKFKALCSDSIPYQPIAIIPEMVEKGDPQDLPFLATSIPYIPYYASGFSPTGRGKCIVNDIAKKIYPLSSIFVDFSKGGLDANMSAKTALTNELNTYYRSELLTCNHISGLRAFQYQDETPILSDVLYGPNGIARTGSVGGCFLSSSAATSFIVNGALNYNCDQRIILDNGGYNNYIDSSSDSLRILVTRTGKRAKLDLISGRLDVRPAGVIHDSLSIRQRGGSPVSLEKATGTSFLQSIESNTNLPITMRLYASDGIADAGFIYKLSCRNLNDPIIRSIDKTVAFESCTLKVFGFNLDSCTFGLSLHTFRAPDSVAADGTWAKFVLPSYNTYTSPVLESTSIFDGSFVYARSLRSGLIVRSPEKLLIRRGRIRINALTQASCEPKQLSVDTRERVLFSEADPNLSRKPYYRWYRLTHGTVSSVSGDTVRCTNCFPSDGRSNQYLLIDKAGEFRIRRRLNASSVQLYPGDNPISGTGLIGRKVSVGGNERMEGSIATITSPGTYWCYDANLGFAGSSSGISCPLIPDTIAVTESDVVQCGLLFAKNSRGKQTSTVETGKLNLKDSAFTFELLLSHDRAGARWDTVSTYKWGTDSSIVNLSSALQIFTDRNGHLAVRLFNGKKIGTAYKQLITKDPLVPKNSYHVAVVRKDSDSLFFFVTPVSSLTAGAPIGYSSLWVDSLPYTTTPTRIPQSQFFRAKQGIKIEDSSSLNRNNHFFLQLFGQDSATQLRGIRLWRGARSEDQIKADALQVLSGEDGGSDNMRQVFDYRFLARAGDSVLQTTPLDPDLVLHFGRSKEPSLSPSSCGMAHPTAALAGPDMYPTSSAPINLASATLNPPGGNWGPTNGVTSAGIFSPLQGRAGDNFVRYNIPTSGAGTARAGCNTSIPLFRRIQLPGQIISPGDSGITPYPWKLYSYQADWGSLNRDSLSFIWEAKHDSTSWTVVDSGQHSTLRYAWVFKSVLGDSLRVRIRVRSAGSISYFTRKLVVKPRYMVEVFGLQSSDTVAATFDSLRIDSIAAHMKYPANQVYGNLPQATLDACGGGGIRACIRLRWLLNGVEQIRDVSSELVATDSGVPMRTTANNPLRPGVYAYTRIRPIPSGSLPLSLQFTFNRLLDNGYYSGYTLPLSVLVQPKVADTTHPLTIRAACVNNKPKLVADSLSTSLSLFAVPGGRSVLDTTWTSGRYTAYGIVNGKCRAGTFGVMNGDTGAYVLDHDTILNGTTIVIKDLLVREDNVHVRLSQNATLYMLAAPPMVRSARKRYIPKAAPDSTNPFVLDNRKMQDIRFEGRGGLQMRAGSSIQGVCNMWGGLQLYSQAYLTVHPYQPVDTNMVMPVIADAYRGVRILDSGAVHEGSRSIPYDSLLIYPKLLLKQFRFLNNRVAIDDRDPHRHLGLIENCIFSCNPAQMKAPYHPTSTYNFSFLGFKAINLKRADGDRVFRNLTIKGYQFGIVGQDSTGRVFVRSSTFDSCATAAVYSRRSEVHFENSYIRFPKVALTNQAKREQQLGDPYQLISGGTNTDLNSDSVPYGIVQERGNRNPVFVSGSRLEGALGDTNFSALRGTGIWSDVSHLTLEETVLRRLHLGVRLVRYPIGGYHSIHGTRFFANKASIYAGVPGVYQNMNLDLTCSSFEPGDTLPDYSGRSPVFKRFIKGGTSVGIRAEARGISEIGRIKDAGTPIESFVPGANIFPLEVSASSGDTIRRNISPDTINVNSIASNWRSPTNWTSILYVTSGTVSPLYHRFKNEFLGTTYPDGTLPNKTGSFGITKANSTDVPDCNQAADTLSFPTRLAKMGLTAGIPVVIENDGYLFANPNPASDFVEIHYQLQGTGDKALLGLFEVTGSKPLWQKQITQARGNLGIDLSKLPPGVYLVRLVGQGQSPLQTRIVCIKK